MSSDLKAKRAKADVVIVGSGPSGLSAAVYTQRAGLKTIVITGDNPGGMLNNTETIENYLGFTSVGGMDLADAMKDHVQSLGVEMIYGNAELVNKVKGGFVTVLSSGSSVDLIESRVVIYAAGSKPKELPSLAEFPDAVSYCATCDGFFYQGEDVAVVGGGESAVEEALYLANIAKTVTLIVRGESLRSTSKSAIDKLLAAPNVHIKFSAQVSGVERITGDSSDESVYKLILTDGSEVLVPVVFVTIGQQPVTYPVEGLVDLDAGGFIERSRLKSLIVTGDVSTPEYRQVAVAVGDGARAGMQAIKMLNES